MSEKFRFDFSRKGEMGLMCMTDKEKLIRLLIKCGVWGANKTTGEIADYLIANGVTAQQWNSVGGEQKPVHGKEYFIRYTFGNSDLHFHGASHFCGNSENGLVEGPHFENEGWHGMRVTHWMEIPKLPELPEVLDGTDHV